MRTPSNPVLSSIGYEASANHPPAIKLRRAGRPLWREATSATRSGRLPNTLESPVVAWKSAWSPSGSIETTPAPVLSSPTNAYASQRCSPGDHRRDRRASRTSSVRGRSAGQFDLRGRGRPANATSPASSTSEWRCGPVSQPAKCAVPRESGPADVSRGLVRKLGDVHRRKVGGGLWRELPVRTQDDDEPEHPPVSV